MLKAENLTKSYKVGFWGRKVYALNDLSLEVAQGEVFGFLGPNGAGKTTTIKILMGLVSPTSGKGRIMDKPIGDVSVRGMIGYLPENPYFYDFLTGEEFLRYHAVLGGMPYREMRKKVQYLLGLVGMTHAGGLQMRKYSKGMIQRIGIAQAIINDPQLVILDEPMSGLDPIGRKEVRDIILGMKSQGVTVFFSTHIIPDVEVICDRVGILNKGRLMSLGKIEELVGQKVKSVEVTVKGLKGESFDDAKKYISAFTETGNGVMISVLGENYVGQVLDIVRKKGGQVLSVTPIKPSLEEIFIEELRQS